MIFVNYSIKAVVCFNLNLAVSVALRKILVICMSLGAATLVSSCSSTDIDENTVEGAFKLAQQYQEMERYEEALRRYNEVRTKFPHSRQAIDSALAVADVYFLQHNFKEAEINYKAFRELHGRHPRIDYVAFRIGLSLSEQLPSTNDRDLSTAPQAIEVFERFLQEFPKSEFAAEAQDKIRNLRLRMADREHIVGSFYVRRGQYSAAVDRFLFLVRTYPESPLVDSSLQKALQAANKSKNSRLIEDVENIMKNRKN